MRSDWVPFSASALVIGAMSVVLGALLNPVTGNSDPAATVRVVTEDGGRWLGMAVMYFIASVGLTLGLPSILTLFRYHARRLGLVAVAVFTVGAIGLTGYSMLMVFFRALVVTDVLRDTGLNQMTHDAGLNIFLYGWIGAFYGGIVLLALALFVARRTPRWVPILLAAFVAMVPFVSHLGRVGMAVQVLLMAIAFTGIAIAAATREYRRESEEQPAF